MKRRDFIKIGGATGLLASTPKGVFADLGLRQGKIIKGRKLNIACIGVGGQGDQAVKKCGDENIVALCDVDSKRASKNFKKHSTIPHYSDYRKMLEEMDDEIDAVTIVTPDHTHFPAAMDAISRGKHVFVEKPLTHTVEQARLLQLAAQRHNVVSQMGIQGHTMGGIRRVKEWIQAGAIGEVRRVDSWTNRPGQWWNQGMSQWPKQMPVPESLDWNLWLGTAPARLYNEAYAPFKWRGWWDFGCGSLGDMGCHILDAPFWALDLGAPKSISAETSPVSIQAPPEWSIVTYEFPSRGERPPVTLKWYDGGKKPSRPEELEDDRDIGGNGTIFYGSKGTLASFNDAYCGSPRLIPESKMKEFAKNLPEKTIPRVGGKYEEWIKACKGEGPKPGANFDYAGPLTEMVQLGNVAIRAEKEIKWDSKRMRCIGDPDANRYLTTDYRQF